MTRDEMRSRVADLLSDIIDREVDLQEKTRADDVEAWDSINHVKLIIAIERAFKVRFNSDEVTAPENVGRLIDTVQEKMAKSY